MKIPEHIFIFLIGALVVSMFLNFIFYDDLKTYEEAFIVIEESMEDYSETISYAYHTLNATKQTILNQADTIENLSIMVLTYQLFLWKNNITIPELDNQTLKWLHFDYDLSVRWNENYEEAYWWLDESFTFR